MVHSPAVEAPVWYRSHKARYMHAISCLRKAAGWRRAKPHRTPQYSFRLLALWTPSKHASLCAGHSKCVMSMAWEPAHVEQPSRRFVTASQDCTAKVCFIVRVLCDSALTQAACTCSAGHQVLDAAQFELPSCCFATVPCHCTA